MELKVVRYHASQQDGALNELMHLTVYFAHPKVWVCLIIPFLEKGTVLQIEISL